jgi:Sel1 repeat
VNTVASQLGDTWSPLVGTAWGQDNYSSGHLWRHHTWFDDPRLKRAGRLYYGTGANRDEASRSREKAEAMKIVLDLAARGNAVARYCIGVWLHQDRYEGQGAPARETAATWFMQAAAHGHVNALVRLGRCLASGFGVPADPRAAYELFVVADNCGDEDAGIEIGECYETGRGVEVDLEEAASFYIKSRLEYQQNVRLPRLGYTLTVGDRLFSFKWVKEDKASGGLVRDSVPEAANAPS